MQGQKKNSSSSGTYEKRKICSTRFHNFRQVEAANEFADFLACTRTYAKKKIGQRFFSRTSKFRNMVTIYKKSKRKLKKLPIILVTYSLLTILVSYKQNLFLLLSMLLHFELPEFFPLLCQTNTSLYSTYHNVTTKKMNKLEDDIFCDATFKHEPSPV